jgi:DNA-binding NtrC family response regulator
VRELRNVIERAMILEEGDVITTKYLPANLVEMPFTMIDSGSFKMEVKNGNLHLPLQNMSLKNVDNLLIRWAMQESGGNKSQAARSLGISRDQLIYRLKTMNTANENE